MSKNYVDQDFQGDEFKAFIEMLKTEPRCRFWVWWEFICVYVDVHNLSYNQGTTGYDKRGYNKEGYRWKKEKHTK